MPVKDLTKIALMVTILIVLGVIPPVPLGFIPVPIVLQNLGVMLAGILLGGKRGTIAVALFLFFVALGFPVLSGGRGGIAIFAGPSAGYFFGWLFTPIMISNGLKMVHNNDKWWFDFIVIWIVGVIFVDLLGTIWLDFNTGMGFGKALVANLVFIPGDTLKAVLTTYIGRRLNHYPQFKD